MRRYIRFFIFALFVTSLAFPQVVTVKRVAKSPADLKVTPWVGPVSAGLRVLGKESTAYFTADTTGSGASAVTSFDWSITSKPGGSGAAFDTTNKIEARFKPDVVGQYIVQVSVNGAAKTAVDTIFVSTFMGSYATPVNCGTCHADKNTEWQATGHANHYKNGITGMLENTAATNFMGVYGKSCASCHTTGFDVNANNGNFGYNAHATGWDTTWYQGATVSGNSYLIPYGDQSRWDLLGTAPYATVKRTATIGCESCHGAGADHMGDKTKIAKSVDAGVCLQCHDAPTHHMVGPYWKESAHATMPLSGEHAGGNTGCYPCHSGSAFAKFVENPTNPGYDAVADYTKSISCASCHDPHNASNPNQLRTVSAPPLANGYAIPAGLGGKGQLCMNCHRNRSNSKATIDPYIAVTPPTKWGSRLYPHHSPVADMFLGQNAYDFGLASLQGLTTHAGVVVDACVTCHMPLRTYNADHSMKMVIDGADKVTACNSCHGNITSFEEIGKADYDGDGVIEGTMVEIDGLEEQLGNLLPKGADGEVITLSNSATRVADSIAIATNQYGMRVFPGIWNYSFIKEDKSHGAHNPFFAIQLIRTTIQYVITGVVPVELTSFTSSISNGVVTLQWQTATEKNNKGFEVQRKIGTKWETISFVNGRGTSTEINKYSYSDNLSKLSVAGNVSYRLRQVDFDGTAIFSKEINVSYTSAPKSFSLSQNYPNPFNPSTTIRYALPFDSNVKISIYKVTGELVKVLVSGTKPAGNYEVTMNTAHENAEFSSGIYFYSIEANAVDGSNSFRQTKKMILLK